MLSYRREWWLFFLKTGVRVNEGGENSLSSTAVNALYFCVEQIRNGKRKICKPDNSGFKEL